MNMETAIEQASTNLVNIDLIPSREKLAEIAEERENNQRHEARARAEAMQLSRQITEYRATTDSKLEAARAFAEGGDVANALDPLPVWKADLEQRRAVIAGFQMAEKQLRAQARAVSRELDANLAAAIQPVSAALHESAKSFSISPLQAFADASAIFAATGNFVAQSLANNLEPAVAELGRTGMVDRKPIAVSKQVLSLLWGAIDVLEFVGRPVTTTVSFPGPTVSPLSRIMFAQGREVGRSEAALRPA